jgi:glycerol-3-phosphate acyltransferase PlsY
MVSSFETAGLIHLLLYTALVYLYGAVPFAYVALFLLKRRDITKLGTGNVSVINAYHAGGILATLVTVAGEISKSLVAVRLAEAAAPGELNCKLWFVLVALVGANYSLFLRGRGGKGSTMLFWSLAQLSFPAFLVMLAVCCLSLMLARKGLKVKGLWPWWLPGVLLVVEQDWRYAVFGCLVLVLVRLKAMNSEDDYRSYGYVPS